MIRSRYTGFSSKPLEEKFSIKRRKTSPLLWVVLGYISLILLGAALLYSPLSAKNHIPFIDALFTANSAVCVTGLSVLDIGASFTILGHSVLLVLMQLGGLGIMTVSTTIILLAGMHPGFNHQSALLSSFTQEGNIDAAKILKAVLPFTFILEAIGAIVYFTQFSSLPLGMRIFTAVFQAVSSFCNVGFTLFPDSLMAFQGNALVNVFTCILAVAGSFGFLAIAESQYLFDFKKKKLRKISLHTKIAAGFTAIIALVSIVFFTINEWSGALKDVGIIDKFLSTFFMGFTSRTAGLNTIDVTSLTASSLFFFIIIMFIGANPGSCGGGIKTTTAAVIFLLGFNRILGRKKTQVLARTIPENTVDKAIRIFVVAIVVIVVATLILLNTEVSGSNSESAGSFLKVLFEVVSAYSTCGLSMGLTGDLSNIGRIVICMVMFVGRMGPLFLISAVSQKSLENMWYAEEDIMVG